MDLSIIVVNYNGGKVIIDCLSSVLKETTRVDYELIIADNNSTDGSVGAIKELFPDVLLIENKENFGFAKANNCAIKESSGKYVLLLNPDTVILSGAIDKLFEFIESKPDAGAACGKAYNVDGTIQHTIGRFPSITNQIGSAISIHKFLPNARLFQERIRSDRYYQHEHPVDWGLGAFLMIRREALDQIGLLDERFFMYAEERDYCYRLWKAGWKVYFSPEAEIIHIGQSKVIPALFAELKNSRMMFISKHYRGIKRGAIWSINVVDLAFRMAFWSSLRFFLSPKSRDEARNKSRACHMALQKILNTAPIR